MRQTWLRAAAIRLIAYPAILYLIVGALFYFWQAKLLYPAPETFAKKTPANIGLPFENLRLAVNARDQLHAWWIPAAAPTEKAILAFHGNGFVLEDMVDGEMMPNLHQLGANLLLVDYRGYGSSTVTTPTEKTINQDADASLDYLLRARTISAGNVWVLGQSIGSGPATYLALNNPHLGGLVLESPFSSIDDAAAAFWYLRIYPTSLMLRTHFDNLAKIGSVKIPVLIASGTADTLTPPWMANQLFAQAHQPKQLYLIPGAGHNDLEGTALAHALRTFIQAKR